MQLHNNNKNLSEEAHSDERRKIVNLRKLGIVCSHWRMWCSDWGDSHGFDFFDFEDYKVNKQKNKNLIIVWF